MCTSQPTQKTNFQMKLPLVAHIAFVSSETPVPIFPYWSLTPPSPQESGEEMKGGKVELRDGETRGGWKSTLCAPVSVLFFRELSITDPVFPKVRQQCGR